LRIAGDIGMGGACGGESRQGQSQGCAREGQEGEEERQGPKSGSAQGVAEKSCGLNRLFAEA
jgi:hypothetical protein